MIAIVDYGMGNLRSVEKALQKLGHAAKVTGDVRRIAEAARVILPGVGAFGAGMGYLNRHDQAGTSLAEAVTAAVESGKPVLGLCLGMQLLLSESEEIGLHAGLDLISGRVRLMETGGDPTLKVPHMGWNELHFPHTSPLFAGLEEGARVYFVHSFICVPEDRAVVSAESTHGTSFCAALSRNNLHATQFHPEKSGAVGLRILDNFARL